MNREGIVNMAVFSAVGRRTQVGGAPDGKSPVQAKSRDAARGSGTRSAGNLPGRMELHSFVDLAHCRRCRDKGVYHCDELVGAITRTGKRWHVWRILDFGQPLDRAELAMYEEQMSPMADFDTLHEARRYIKGPFCEMILRELEPQKKKEK